MSVAFPSKIGVTAGVVAALAVLANCLDDPRKDDPVRVTNSCTKGALSTDPSSPQSTLRAFLDASEQLLVRATATEAELRDACNALDVELGLPTGTDAVTACKSIGARVEEVSKKGPIPNPGLPQWAELRFAPDCTVAPEALGQCISSCAGPCETAKCEAGQLAAPCYGECKGLCLTEGEDIPCNGSCVGEIPIDGEPTTCSGECQGVCTGADWSARCTGSCAGAFRGSCAGTCTGQCDGQPINTDPTDAGTDGRAPGDGGSSEAPSLVEPPPTNADGNCKGLCVGVCSKGANGYCHGAPCLDFPSSGAPALAPFSGGNCFSGGCGGLCKTGFGSGATKLCRGKCTQKKAQCDGLCLGECSGTQGAAPLICKGKLRCNQNVECENACQARAQLATTCAEPRTLEMYAITDPALLAAFQRHGAKLAKPISELRILRTAFGFLGRRAYGDFVTIGLRGDLARACVAKAVANVADADVAIRAIITADPTVRKL
ncbi:hypothetical protein [Pendulispora albinea]|uniref:Uncharacterized protein n=1 Tax=Pendulispora albinea TaxID=2741071 RepID=A0ABZ2M3W2_9BACT